MDQGKGIIKTQPIVDMVNTYISPDQDPEMLVSHMRERYFQRVIEGGHMGK